MQVALDRGLQEIEAAGVKLEPDLSERLRLPFPAGGRLPDIAAERDQRAAGEQQGYQATDDQ